METLDLYSKMFKDAQDTIDGYQPQDFIPAPNRVLVKAFPPDAETKGGLLIPDRAQEQKSVGVVLALPPDTPVPYEMGQIVVFRKGSGEALTFEGHDGLLLLTCHGELDDDIIGSFPLGTVPAG